MTISRESSGRGNDSLQEKRCYDMRPLEVGMIERGCSSEENDFLKEQQRLQRQVASTAKDNDHRWTHIGLKGSIVDARP